MTGRTALITIAHGRHNHLLRQYEALAASTALPNDLIVVAMGDTAIAALPFGAVRPRIVTIPVAGERLPLAAARNAGARAALQAGADVLVFLDVDCLPSSDLVHGYEETARDPRWANHLLCGPVAYLPPPAAGGYDLTTLDQLADPHPARPAPPIGDVIPGDDFALFWSLSFALTAETWQRIGGFCEEYEGYGAEDTDFAVTARAAEVGFAWVGTARAFHQYHPTSSPPVQHLEDIVRNANIYFARFGEWPMGGWLAAFEAAGLIRWTPTTLTLL